MDSQEPVFDNVKFEKAKAMARFNRFRKITKLLQFLKVFVALMLISWWSTHLPGALKISGEILFEVGDYLFKPHVVFVIGNAIIVALFVLCRVSDAGIENSGDGDIYDDYARHSEAHAEQRKRSVSDRDENSAPEPPHTPEINDMIADSGDGDEQEEEKQIVCVFPEEKTEQCKAVSTAIEKATKKLQRIQSEKLKREIAVKPQGELRRSETVKVGRRLNELDELSDEEFNKTAWDYIIKGHQEFRMEQS